MIQQLTVIMYHYVRELPKTRYPDIKGLLVSEFEYQLEYLKKEYNFIRIEDCINAFINNHDLPPNSCLLTFDDGYIDHFENVFPLLKDNNIQGCFFPPARAIIKSEVLDVNKIHFILAAMSNELHRLLEDVYDYLDEFRSDWKLRSNKYYYSKLAEASRFDPPEIIFIKRLLQAELDEKLRNIITNKLFAKYVTNDEKSFSKELYMNVDHLKFMLNDGMYVGSHGYHHYWLDKLAKEKQEIEIVRSLDFLKSLGAPTLDWVMCYPYGAYNNTLIDLLKDSGCALAFTTEVGHAQIKKENAFTIQRFDTNDFPPVSNKIYS